MLGDAGKNSKVRIAYFALGTATVVFGMVIHFHGFWIPRAARDAIGDALWATMLACWISVITPQTRPTKRYCVALLLCFAVELSQLWHTPVLDYGRSTHVGQLVLGSGFDPRDFAAYAFGVMVFVWLDRRWILRSERQI